MKATFIIDGSDDRCRLIHDELLRRGFVCGFLKDNATASDGAVYILSPSHRIVADAIADGGKVFCFGGQDDTEIADVEKRGGKVFNLMQDREFVEQNSRLTAEGALMHVIANTDRCLSELHILHLGYGFLGKADIAVLGHFCKNLTVATRNVVARAEAELIGVRAMDFYEARRRIGEFDTIINTVPARIWDEPPILKAGTFVLELASRVYPFDYEGFAAAGVKYLIAKAVPSKLSVRSAAKLLLDTVLRISEIE